MQCALCDRELGSDEETVGVCAPHALIMQSDLKVLSQTIDAYLPLANKSTNPQDQRVYFKTILDALYTFKVKYIDNGINPLEQDLDEQIWKIIDALGKTSDTGNSTIAQNTPTEYTLTIDRASQVYAVNPPVKVVIDNSIRLNIENGQTESINLSIGTHTVELKSSFRSTSLTVDMTENKLIEVSWNRLTGKLVATVCSN